MSNYEKVRERIAKFLAMRFVYSRDDSFDPLNFEGLPKNEKEQVLKDAASILSDPDILIRADNQTLPHNNENDIMNTSPKRVCNDTQKEMLKSGFVKVEPKE